MTTMTPSDLKVGEVYATTRELVRGGGRLVRFKGLDEAIEGRFVLEFVSPGPGVSRQLAVADDVKLTEATAQDLAGVAAAEIFRAPLDLAVARLDAASRDVLLAVINIEKRPQVIELATDLLMAMESDSDGGDADANGDGYEPQEMTAAMLGNDDGEGDDDGPWGMPTGWSPDRNMAEHLVDALQEKIEAKLGEAGKTRAEIAEFVVSPKAPIVFWRIHRLKHDIEAVLISEGLAEPMPTSDARPEIVEANGGQPHSLLARSSGEAAGYNGAPKEGGIYTKPLDRKAYEDGHDEGAAARADDEAAGRPVGVRGWGVKMATAPRVEGVREQVDAAAEALVAGATAAILTVPAKLTKKVKPAAWLKLRGEQLDADGLAMLEQLVKGVRPAREALKGVDASHAGLLKVALRYLDEHSDVRPVETIASDIGRKLGQLEGTNNPPGRPPKERSSDNDCDDNPADAASKAQPASEPEPAPAAARPDNDCDDAAAGGGDDLLEVEGAGGDVGPLPAILREPQSMARATDLPLVLQVAGSSTARSVELIPNLASREEVTEARCLEGGQLTLDGYAKGGVEAAADAFVAKAIGLIYGQNRAEVLAALDRQAQAVGWHAPPAPEPAPEPEIPTFEVGATYRFQTEVDGEQTGTWDGLQMRCARGCVSAVGVRAPVTLLGRVPPPDGHPERMPDAAALPLDELAIVSLPDGTEDVWHRPPDGVPSLLGKSTHPALAPRAAALRAEVMKRQRAERAASLPQPPPQEPAPTVGAANHMKAAQATLAALATGLPALNALGLDVEIRISTRRG